MALEDLNDLFGAVDGFTDDLMEYGAIALTATATGAAFAWGSNTLVNKFWPTAPPAVKTWGIPLLHIGLGAAAPALLGRFGAPRSVVTGASVGLIGAGLTMLIRSNFPDVPLAGLGAAEDEVLLGLGDDLYQRYLGDGSVGTPTTIEEPMNGFNGATASIEESMSGLSNWDSNNPTGVASSFN